MESLLALFVLVLLLNILPAFAPPTWMLLSFFGLGFPDTRPWLVALVAATAATSGRLVLARLAQRIVARGWLPAAVRRNLDAVAQVIEARRSTSVAAFLVFAFSPLPSNALFIAYGLTRAPLRLLAVPFFAGRSVSYALAFAGGALVGRRVDGEWSGAASWAYFVATQLTALALVLAFARIDWRASWAARRVCWVRATTK